MREIKFRCWDKLNKIMDYEPWGPEYLCEGVPINDCLTSFPSSEYSGLMQFTGLLDKNGKEIFEADILNWPDSFKAQVLWCEEDCAFQISTIGHIGGAFLNQEYMLNFEIIGNIHQNPELLGEK